MRLGIRNLEWIDSAKIHDYSQLAPGSSLNINSYIVTGGSFTALPFTPETGDLSEDWSDDEGGQHSNVAFSASIRANKDAYRNTLQQLLGKKVIWKLTLISGIVYIIGSKEYVPKFTFSDSISGQSSSEFTINIENDSTHGLLLHSVQ